ncbi:hypothetical protein BJY01DRAFT_46169 [Aspergillus pseudoustus]|uniref:Uncharacterized protein n=1 Tax=Aspergillus pseudoustus TaxID=1810923 RepID=A0ABR4JB94_9EURO
MAGITESRQSIGEYFAEKRIPTSELLHPIRELEDALSRWAPLGNLKPILEIMRLRRYRISEVEGYLAGIDLDPTSKTCFAPFPLTVATWLIHSMVVRSWDQKSKNRVLEEKEINTALRHKIRVIRDSVLWMKDLSGSMGNWEWHLFPPSDVNSDRKSERAIRENLVWLQGGEVKKFYNKRSDQVDQSRIDELWEMFVKKEDLPVKCAFCLAQMGAKGSWDAEDKVNIQSNWVPQEWFEYYQVISILLVCGNRSR